MVWGHVEAREERVAGYRRAGPVDPDVLDHWRGFRRHVTRAASRGGPARGREGVT